MPALDIEVFVVKKRAFLTVTLLSLVPFGAHANVHQAAQVARGQNFDASLVAPARVVKPWSANPAVALSRDPVRGVPSMLVSPSAAVPAAGSTAEDAARFHLLNMRDAYGVPRAALTGARLRFVHDLGRGGIIVSLRQMLAGVEVFHGDIKVMLDRNDHRLLGIAGSPHPAAMPGNRKTFTLAKSEAITTALVDLYGAGARGSAEVVANGKRKGGWDYFELADSRRMKFKEPARVKPVYFPLGDTLVAGWFLEVQVKRANGEVDAFQYVIAADDGRLLYRRDLTAYDMYKYRVWAEPGGDKRPLDGPMEDWTPHPTGMPDQGPTNFTVPTLIQVEGFNTNPNNLPDPWLAPGATVTNGNNVDAYVDWNDPDGLDGMEFRANVSANKTFDYIYNPLLEPLANQTQSKASIVQIFYDINWMHDWWYDSGFVEATGVAQLSDYGRPGGVEGDPMKAEAQDGALKGSRNNANMSTPADGEKPRMQMFLWNRVLSDLTLDIQPSGVVTTPNQAAFGPKNYDIMADLVLASDGMGMNVNDLCEPAVNDLVGKIALIDRGTCTFESKVARAQAAGAIGAIIANHLDGDVNPGMGLDPNTPDPIIPSVGITQNNGIAVKAAMMQQQQTAHIVGMSQLLTERDGTIDNMIVAHEFGHYWHHRLQDCGTKQCSSQSEGWGDFHAAMMNLRDGDDYDGVFSDSTYASFDETGYFGIRRVPYSASFDKNALTFKNITVGVPMPNNHPIAGSGDNSEVHNAGEVWCTAMWEAYTSLQKEADGQTFAELNRAMSDYAVGGLMMTPTDATFTETRDGILATARAADEDHFLTLANAFARRGMGSCAVSPAKDSVDNTGLVEDFELHANGIMSGVPSISDDILSCDDDGIVDVGEIGSIRVKVTNIGALFLPKGSTVEIIDPPASLSFPDGLTAPVDALAPYQSLDVAITVTVNEPLVDNLQEVLKIRLNTPAGCVPSSETFLPIDLNADLAPNSSSFDDVETTTSAWTPGGALFESVWSRQPALTDGWFWHGNDIGTDSDTNLTTPTLMVSANDPFIISFDHRFTFEFSDNTHWDGGLVEISEDDGMTWNDASTYGAVPTYIAVINSMANPINGKLAYAHRNAAYPAREAEVLDFGTALAGKAVKFRFRIGTDAAAGDLGWDIDNINFEGITNTPFSSWIPDEAICIPDESTTGETGGETGTGTGETGGETGTGTGGETGTGTGETGGETGTGTGETGGETGTGTTVGLEDTGDTSVGTLETSAGETSTTDGPSETSVNPTDTSAGTDGDTGNVPTTGFDPSNPSNPSDPTNDDEETGDSESETDPGEIVDDEGCGCAVDDEHGWGWQIAPWLALLGLGRRRRRV